MQGVSTERIRLSNYLNMHWVCVLKDIQGIYSLLSPSNHLVGGKSMFEIFEATEIDQILNQLYHSESGIWPTVKFLQSHYRTPQITPKGIQVPKFKFDNRKQMKLSIDNITESVFSNPF